MTIIVPGKKSCFQFHKDLYSDLCFAFQGSILGPLLCHVFLNMKETSFASYADDNTPYVTAENLDEVIKSSEKDSIKLFQGFSDNQMKVVRRQKCRIYCRYQPSVKLERFSLRSKRIRQDQNQKASLRLQIPRPGY